MGKENYEMLGQNDHSCDELFENRRVRKGVTRKTRMFIVFIIAALCAAFILVALKFKEEYDGINEEYAEETTKVMGGLAEVTTTEIPTTLPKIINTTVLIPQATATPVPVTTLPNTTVFDRTTIAMTTNNESITSNLTTPIPISTSTAAPPIRIRREIQNSKPEKTEDSKKSAKSSKSVGTETGFSPLYRKSTRVCTSLRCKTTGSRLLSLLDNSVEPCDDFYQFVCGGLKDEVTDTNVWKTLLDQLSLINNSSLGFLQKYKAFYDSCISHETVFNHQSRIAVVTKLVKEVGEIVSDKNEAELDLTKLFAKLILRQSLRFMDIDIGIDSKDTSFLLTLSIPSKPSKLKETGHWLTLSDDQQLCLPEQIKSPLSKTIDLNKIHDAYVDCQKKHTGYLDSIESVVRSLGFLTGDTASQNEQVQDLKSTIQNGFLTHLNELPTNQQRKILTYNKFETLKISNLQDNYKVLQWKTLVETLTGHTVEETSPVQVYFAEYFSKVFGEIEKLPKWKVNNALISIYAQELYENLVIPQARHNREDYCVQLASEVLPDVSSHLYMKMWTDKDIEDAQSLLTKVFSQLKTKLSAGIEKAEWVDAPSKTSMLSKLKNDINLLYNKKDDVFNDAAKLEAKYEPVMLNASNFIENAATMLETSRKWLFDIQGKVYDVKLLWGNLVNAFDGKPSSYYSTGLVVAPMGVIKYPVKEEFPGYLTMAQLGLPIARELGRQFDLVGVERGVTLSDAPKRSFAHFKEAMTDKVLLTGTKPHTSCNVTFQADPALSANERIIDNTAVRMVSDSIHTLGEESVLPWVSQSYSIEQIFFIAVAQEFCKKIDVAEFMDDIFDSDILPPSLRVENIITNSEAFSKVFECSNESPMNKIPHYKAQFPNLQKVE